MNWFFKILNTDRKLGMRIIKTGVAVTVCVAISSIFNLGQPLVAVIATVMSMGRSIDASLRSGKNKIIGVIIGAALGGLFAMLSPANAGLCGIGIILVLYLCYLAKLDMAGTLASFVFAAVMFVAEPGAGAWNCALTCAEDAVIGIVVAVIVNFVVMPPNYAEQIKKLYDKLVEQVSKSVEDTDSIQASGLCVIKDNIDSIEHNIELYTSEVKILRWNDEEISEISDKVKVYIAIFEELKAAASVNVNGGMDSTSVYKYHKENIARLYAKTARGKKEKANKSNHKM